MVDPGRSTQRLHITFRSPQLYRRRYLIVKSVKNLDPHSSGLGKLTIDELTDAIMRLNKISSLDFLDVALQLPTHR